MFRPLLGHLQVLWEKKSNSYLYLNTGQNGVSKFSRSYFAYLCGDLKQLLIYHHRQGLPINLICIQSSAGPSVAARSEA